MPSRREQAGLPPGGTLLAVTLNVMRKISLPASNGDIDAAIADALQLTDEQRALPFAAKPGVTELAYRAAWSRTLLHRAGATKNAGRALWTLTEEGWVITAEEVQRRYDRYLSEKRGKSRPQKTDAASDGVLVGDDPEDSDWQTALVERLKGMSPGGFEHLAAALLRVAGFDDVDVTGRSGDGGIDGIGVYRPSGLISFHTAFQCKRYQGSVGASTVRDFRGSFVGRADRGIIITTGYFTRDARDEAARPGANPVDLIDGEALCELLREHSLGVRTTQRVVEDIIIDDAYFNQFDAAEETS